MKFKKIKFDQVKPEKRQVNSLLRKAVRDGTLVGRKIYHDYYDSCHPPTETPDAPFKPVRLHGSNGDLDRSETMTISADQLTARYTVFYSIAEDGITIKASLFYGNIEEEFRIVEGG